MSAAPFMAILSDALIDDALVLHTIMFEISTCVPAGTVYMSASVVVARFWANTFNVWAIYVISTPKALKAAVPVDEFPHATLITSPAASVIPKTRTWVVFAELLGSASIH